MCEARRQIRAFSAYLRKVLASGRVSLWQVTQGGQSYAGEPEARARLAAVLREVAWRNDKASVADELGLPPRTLQACRRPHVQRSTDIRWCFSTPASRMCPCAASNGKASCPRNVLG